MMSNILWFTLFGIFEMILAITMLWKGFDEMISDIIGIYEKIKNKVIITFQFYL